MTPAVAALLVALAGIAVYLPTAANGFVFDDVDIAARNPLAHEPANLSGIFGSHYWANVTEGGNLYRPLTIWSFALNSALTGPGAAGYHVVNAILHGLVCALVVLLAAALGLSPPGAAAAGLLFALHPIHVEAVAPVVGRSELLAALFVLAGWVLHLTSTRAAAERRSGGAWAARAGAALLFGAGLLSKENAAVLPAFVVAGDLAREGRRGIRRSLPTLALMAPVGLAVLAVRLAVVPGLPPDSPLISVFGGVDPVTRILTATGVLGRYLWLLLVPMRLSADYSFHQIPLIESAANPLFLVSAAVMATLTIGAALLVRRGRMSGLAIVIFLLAIFPVSNIPVSIGTVMGERLLYLPSVGLCLAVPFLWSERRTRGRSRALRLLAVSALVVVCLLYSARIFARTGDWKDNFTLFSATVRTSPRSAKAWYNLGVAQDGRGDSAAAMSDYLKAVDIKPDMAQAHRNLGLDMLAAGQAPEALDHLREAARLDPGIADIFSDVGIALDRMGRLEEARKAFEEEISRRPDGPRAHYNLGTVLLEQGRPAEAVEALQRAVSLAPDDPDARVQLGMALSLTGRFDQALESMEKALALDPGAAGALQDLARSAKAAGRPDIASRALQLVRGGHGRPGGEGQVVKEK